MKYKIKYFPRLEYSFKELAKSMFFVLLFLLLHYQIVRQFPYIVKSFRHVVECYCENIMAFSLIKNEIKHILDCIVYFIEQSDVVVPLLIYIILSSIRIERIRHLKERFSKVFLEIDEGSFILKFLPRRRE